MPTLVLPWHLTQNLEAALCMVVLRVRDRSLSLDLQRTLPYPTPKGFTCTQGGAVPTRATLLMPPKTRHASVRRGRMAAHTAPIGLSQACITGRPWPPRAPGSIHCTKETESSVLEDPGGHQGQNIYWGFWDRVTGLMGTSHLGMRWG